MWPCPARLSGARQTDLRGVLRHQAAGSDQLSQRLRLAGQRSRTPAGDRVRQQQRDIELLGSRVMRVSAAIPNLLPGLPRFWAGVTAELQAPLDADVAEAMAALAATFETASQGLIYGIVRLRCRPSASRRRSRPCWRRPARERDPPSIATRPSCCAELRTRSARPTPSIRQPARVPGLVATRRGRPRAAAGRCRAGAVTLDRPLTGRYTWGLSS